MPSTPGSSPTSARRTRPRRCRTICRGRSTCWCASSATARRGLRAGLQRSERSHFDSVRSNSASIILATAAVARRQHTSARARTARTRPSSVITEKGRFHGHFPHHPALSANTQLKAEQSRLWRFVTPPNGTSPGRSRLSKAREGAAAVTGGVAKRRRRRPMGGSCRRVGEAPFGVISR
jgi:hypothetical protein